MTNKEELITKIDVCKKLSPLIDIIDGQCFWKKSPSKYKNLANKKAGYKLPQGYIIITTAINGNNYHILGHQLQWFKHFGYIPEIIDHINQIKDDNRIENLRECTKRQNNINTRSYRNKTSKYRGVHWCKRYKKWRASIGVMNKKKSLGSYTCEGCAAHAYNVGAEKYHEGFGILNKVDPCDPAICKAILKAMSE
jgi:hypothetical protein